MFGNSLLNKVTALPYAARFQALREAGLEAKTKPKIAALLDAWEHGDWQERLFCVQSCTGSGDASRLRRMIDDPSRTIANLALRLLAKYASDDVLLDLLPNLPHRRRKVLLKRLRELRRLVVIDGFLDHGFATAIPRIAELLAYGSAAAVQRHFTKAEESGGGPFWRRLARRQPRLAAQAMLDRLEATEQPDALLLRYAQDVVQYAERAAPDMMVPLIRVLAHSLPLAQLHPAQALFHRPNEFAAIILDSDGSQPFSLLPIAHRLEPTIRLRIMREQPNALPIEAHWLRRLPASERLTIFQEVGRSWRDAEGLIPLDTLALLPARERMAEAERMTALPLMSTRPQLHAAYAAYLPWEKMWEIADRFLCHPEGEWRGWGWTALLTGVRYQRNQAADVLAMIRKRKYEQDPVRLVILQNLTALPAGIWQELHLIELAGIVREALDATDLSHSSAVFLSAFVQKLIPIHTHWAAQQLVIIFRERGNIGGYFLEGRINDAQALILEREFLDVGNHWGRGNRVGWLYMFASALGKRLRVCTQLQKVLETLLGHESAYFDASIVALLREHLPPGEFSRLCQYLISKHESWVAIPTIFQFLHFHRQDWLEPFLRKSKFRMNGGATVELVHLLPRTGYQRYTLSQQTALAKTLNDLIRLPAGNQFPKDVWTMLAALEILARLPAIDVQRLIDLSNDKRPVIAESAMRALGRNDAGQGIPILVAALGDDRARIAIYALRRAMAEAPAQRVVSNLQNVSLTKVTVAKETIRLVAEFGGVAGFEWLIALARQDLHRDVRIAVLRGLWDHLEHSETWSVLTAAARSSDGQILNGVVRIPADRLSESARRKLIELLTSLASHPDAVVRLAVLQRFIDLPLPDTEGRLVQTALNSLAAASPDERKSAALVIAAIATPSEAPAIAAAVAQLERRPLRDFVVNVATQAATNGPIRRRLSPTARAVRDSLRADPITAGLRLTLTAGILGVEEFSQELQGMIDANVPVAAVAAEAIAAIEQFGQSAERTKLPHLEATLAESEDSNLRWLAFQALLAQARDHRRWDEDRCSRLSKYRNDPAPLVAICAQFFFDADPP
ncbi:MAG: hypothetical protein JSS02_10185 [Planctomycetes bacterium]|nr:hypothetical protein [Planctomycetota bacterium]